MITLTGTELINCIQAGILNHEEAKEVLLTLVRKA